MHDEPKHPVQAVGRTAQILDGLKSLNGARLQELADHVDMPKSTVHKYLQTLRANSLVVQDGDEYRMGIKFLTYGTYVRNQLQIYQHAKPELKKLADDTGERANLGIEEYGLGYLLHVSKGEDAIQTNYAGEHFHLHCTAWGKAILSAMSIERVRQIIEYHGLPQITKNTITDANVLIEELQAIQQSGVAYNRSEAKAGVRAVSAPVKTVNGDPLGAISIAGPKSRLKGERFDEHLPERVIDVANVIEVNFTYSS